MRALLLLGLTGCWGTMESYFAQDVVDMDFDIPYAGVDDPRRKLDLYSPRGLDDAPVAVFIHGGFWMRQDKEYFQPIVGLYRNAGIALAREGITTAVINYRLVPDVTFDETFGDVIRAIEWTRDNVAGGDASRMIVVGHSAGGHMTALAAFTARVPGIRAYVPLSPILDVAALQPFEPDIVEDVFGTDLVTHSPRTYFNANIPPMRIVLGSDDLDSLLEQVPAAVADLQALGAPVELITLPGKNHEDIVLDFDTSRDQVTPLIVPLTGTD